MELLPKDIIEALERMHLVDDTPCCGEPLTGGVSSDIWQIDLSTGPICVKRALPRLRVEAHWTAPVERNLYEARWIRVASQAVPDSTPRLLAQDEQSGMLAMTYLPSAQYPLWKASLRDGVVDVAFAAAVASILGRIHATTALNPSLATDFPTDALFYDIRLDPYLMQLGRVFPDLEKHMEELTKTTLYQKHALVHGDVSPKNILSGPNGPIFLDAECAWWGDPAFDLAFCLNHLMLKCLWIPSKASALLQSFKAMVNAYLPLVVWEPAAVLEARAARLLPALFLARVDGKSPVEYVTQEVQRDKVRHVARRLLADAPNRLDDVVGIWKKEIAA